MALPPSSHGADGEPAQRDDDEGQGDEAREVQGGADAKVQRSADAEGLNIQGGLLGAHHRALRGGGAEPISAVCGVYAVPAG